MRFLRQLQLRFGGGGASRRMTKGVPKATPALEMMFPWWPPNASASSATGVLRELAWDSGCTGGASPVRDCYWEELNWNRLGSHFSEERLSYCKRGSGEARTGVSPLSSEEVHCQAGTCDASQLVPAPRLPWKWQLQQPLREGKSCPAPPPLRPSP